MDASLFQEARKSCEAGRRSSLQIRSRWALATLLIGIALPTGGQEHSLSHIDGEILRLTPVNRQLDFMTFQTSLGTLRSTGTYGELFHFNSVLLPAATWTDEDPDNSAKRHLATTREIRHSVIPQSNPRGTISFLLNGNGETLLDSEGGQTGFRSNGPTLPDAANPDSETPVSGS
jgi:hypothetical protein